MRFIFIFILPILEERLESDGVPKPKECADSLGEEKGPSVVVASEGLLGSAAAAGVAEEGNGAGMVKRASSSSSLSSNEVFTGILAATREPSCLEVRGDESWSFVGEDIFVLSFVCSRSFSLSRTALPPGPAMIVLRCLGSRTSTCV
jgi:hypothetical protein